MNSPASDGGVATGTVRCPTCRAEQSWSDCCRRCKSDLGLLRVFAEANERSRARCLEAIRLGDAQAASHHAQRCHSLRPDADSARLLALAALLRGDWPVAAALASENG